jgi:cytochrome c biogenesis protein CcmG/thiol:disulfide interchange protein DsbE
MNIARCSRNWLTAFLWGFLVVACGPAHATSLLELDQYHGRVVYLDFWASWCTPCRQSFPWMQSMLAQHGKDGLVVVAVNLDRKQQDADRFLSLFRPAFDVRFDPFGEEAQRWKIRGMPTSVLIDRNGTTRYTHTGFAIHDAAQYEDQLNTLLRERAATK